MTRLFGWRNALAMLLFLAVTASSAHTQTLFAQTFTTLFTFDGADGSAPAAALVQGPDGNFYGTTLYGGANCKQYAPLGCGTVFTITPTGALTSLYSFCAKTNCADGAYPQAALLLANDGNFYGTTLEGGANCPLDQFPSCGTVFKISPAGKLTTLYTFCSQTNCVDGASPYAGLTQGVDGSFYGTTQFGGVNCPNCGTVFRITPAGTLTTLYSFCAKGDCSDGFGPQAGLLLASDGNFYGTTTDGGLFVSDYGCEFYGGCGTVFKISPLGKLTTLYDFCSQSCADGSNPEAGLIQAADGDFYGTTTDGGIADCETENGPVGCGTIFRITAAGEFTLVQELVGTNGYSPSGLIQASDLNLYGTALFGGSESNPDCAWPLVDGCGTVFKITADDKIITLHNFCTKTSCLDGAWPGAGLLQATNGDLYGTNGDTVGVTSGTVFRLSGGLPPFVALVQAAGRVGQSGGILGQGFTGTTGVFLNGMAASFTVVSDTYIRATVPVGATGGFVTVDTPSGTLTSNVPFRVIP